jgi:hypothetical protein
MGLGGTERQRENYIVAGGSPLSGDETQVDKTVTKKFLATPRGDRLFELANIPRFACTCYKQDNCSMLPHDGSTWLRQDTVETFKNKLRRNVYWDRMPCISLKVIRRFSVDLVRERILPTERPPLVGEVSANFCGYRGVTWSVRRIPYSRNLGFLDRFQWTTRCYIPVVITLHN